MSWVGGKKGMREEISNRFPSDFNTYVEVFGGAGWVLFFKNPMNHKEVFNDLNFNVVNLYQCVRNEEKDLIKALEFTLNAREDFKEIRKIFRSPEKVSSLDHITQAAYFYQLIKHSFASKCTSFRCQPHDIWRDFPQIRLAHERHRNVIIENQDFETLIQHYDSEHSFFYCDPPYYGAEKYYKDIIFSNEGHIRLFHQLENIKGKFLLSYNDYPQIRELYQADRFCKVSIKRVNKMNHWQNADTMYDELLIANYDMNSHNMCNQLSMFTK